MKKIRSVVVSIKKDERGLASFVIVSVLVILLTLISVGFAKLMDRAQNNSLNNQLSTAASYAAQSALNNASSALIKQLQTDGTVPTSNTCDPPSNYGSPSRHNPLKDVYDSGNLSSVTDGNPTDRTASYTCILVNDTPTSLVYQQVPADNSEVVKLLPSNGSFRVDQILFGWQASAGTNNDVPPPAANSGKFFDEKTWNTNKTPPLLRVALYPINAANNVMGTYTYFMYPTNAPGSFTTTGYNNNGKIIPTRCGSPTPTGGFNGTQVYLCNSVITGLAALNASYFYARVTPIYVNTDFNIEANYTTGGGSPVTVAFSDAQATVDVTAKDGTAIKRLQGAVDLTGVSASGSTSSNGVAAGNHDIAEYGLQSAAAICKRYSVVSGIVNPTATGDACQNVPSITLPAAPTVALVANPTSITSGGSSTISWTITSGAPIASCSRNTTGGPSAVPAWNSNVSTTSPGSQAVTLTDLGTYNFAMTCTDVLGRSAGDTKSVTVTSPGIGGVPPTVTLVANPTQVAVGGSSTLTWTVANATSCTASGDWSGNPSAAGGSQPTGALSSSKVYNYNIVCVNSYGATPASAAVSTTGAPPPPPGGGGGGTRGTIVVHVNIQRHNLTWDAIDNPGTDGDGLAQCDLNIGGPNYATQYINLFGYSGGGPGRLGQQSGSIAGNYPTGTNAILICQAVDGATPGTASSTVPIPPIVIQTQYVDGYDFYGSYGGATCHDGLHPYILCVSWNATQDDGIYHIGSYPPGNTGGVVANNCVLSYNGGGGRYSTTPGQQYGSPILYEYWNRTLGWNSDPGTVSGVAVTCTSDTYGNSNSQPMSDWTSGFCYTQAGSGCNGTGAGGSGGSGGGCTVNCGGGDGPPPPPQYCNQSPYGGGTWPVCYCLYPGPLYPNCAPPPGGGGGGCGINLPGKTELFPEFGFLTFVPFTGFVIC